MTVEMVQPVVNGYGLEHYLDNLWLEAGDIRELELVNPFLDPGYEVFDNIPELIIETCRDSDYLHFVAKYILNIDLLPYQCVILQTFWNKPLPMLIASRGGGKSWLLAVYICLRLILHQGCRICIVGASLRQSMVIFNYCQQIWDSGPVLRDICGGKKSQPRRDQHMCYWNVGISRAVFLPLGTGDKIRGQRANVIIADEFASIPSDIFETVVRGFAAVKSDGVMLNVQQAYKSQVGKVLGMAYGNEFTDILDDITEGEAQSPLMENNQIVIAGTAFYQFNHFYEYFERYKNIILGEEFDTESLEDVRQEDYAIIRIPYDCLPPGLMDEGILTQGKLTMDPQIFEMEYGACFPADSEGFFKATWLQLCTAPFVGQDGKEIDFAPRVAGETGRVYVMGIDPASEDDRFAINIIEFDDPYRKVVYQWSTNRKMFEEDKRKGLIIDDIKDYNTFCAKHIRDLVRRFGISLIVMDSGGGGLSVKESLKDEDKFLSKEDQPIYDMDDEETMGLEGHHILKMIEFSSAIWRKESHHGLRKDILDRKLAFPHYDTAQLAVEVKQDVEFGIVYDTTDDCYVEIEECKKELTLIKHSQTPNGAEKWDVPKIMGVDAEQVKKRIKKDRFTSILLSNWGCRLLAEDTENFDLMNYGVGASLHELSKKDVEGARYQGRGARRMKNGMDDIKPTIVKSSHNSGNRGSIYY